MDKFVETNRLNWDARLPVHQISAFYDLAAFRAGKITLDSIVRSEVGDVDGRTLLHLQCHFGLDTLSRARLGATATGVDFSERAIKLARSLAVEVGVGGTFICSDVYRLPDVLNAQFDVVFTSWGVLTWLPDVPGWAAMLTRFVRPGGTFYIVEGHPVISGLDDEGGLYRSSAPYFQGPEPMRFDDGKTYADPDALVEQPVNYQWTHPVGEVVTALIDAGFRLEFLHEHPVLPWRRFESMDQGADGWWRLAGDPFPLSFSILARKPT
jgi:SAM-dependent methyltransferase